ncbi:MAG: NADPH:quinone reductase [Candidatus Nanopelagicales bacterium]
MLAAYYSQRGNSDVLTVDEIGTPGPGVGEVRVRLHVAAVNPTDWKSRAHAAPMDFDVQVPGQDGAGVIEAVGPGVDIGRIGERVWVYHAAFQRQYGTAAQFTVVPTRQAVPIPDGISIDQAAALGIPYLTAYGCLFTDGPLDGQTVLVQGGAGAVGHAAIQLARRAGAHVVATVSSEAKGEIAAEAGAHVVVDYTAAGAVEAIRSAARAGVDRIIEVDLTRNLDLDLAVIVPGGVIVTYAADAADPALPVRTLMTRNATLRFALVYGFPPALLAAGVAEVTAGLAAGDLTPLPVVRFSLADIAAAHDAVQSRTPAKVLVDIP